MLSDPRELISFPDLAKPDLMDQSLTTPVGASDAPAEILQHIFVLDAESHTGFQLRPGAKHPALRLAHVCRVWRAAALGTSILWSQLKVDISPTAGASDCTNGNAASSWRWRSALDQFLVLAQNFPLHIMLTCLRMSQWRTNEEIQDILSALFHTSPRWKSLCLVFRSNYGVEDLSFLSPLHDKLDSLETLHVIVFQDYGPPPPLSRCTAFRDAPKLTEAYIMPKNTILVELPWSRLIYADFTVDGGGDKDLMAEHVLVGLQKADQLKTLMCHESYSYFDVPVLDQPIIVELPRLEEITLYASSQLGHWLILPSLSKLRIIESRPHSKDDPVLSPQLIQSLVARSQCNIISLTISDVLASRTLNGLRQIADLFPQLVSFRFEQDLREEFLPSGSSRRAALLDVSMGVFSFLTGPPTAGYFTFSLLENVTLLTHIEALDPDDVFEIFPSLSEMLVSRAQPDSAAARVYTYARVYEPTKTQKFSSRKGRVYGRYHRYEKVEDDPRWQILTGEYRGQINILIQVIETRRYDYQIWLGRTPEPENLWCWK